MGVIEDVERAVTMDLKQPGNLLYLVGELAPPGAAAMPGCWTAGNLPGMQPSLTTRNAPRVYRALHRAIAAGWVRACHDLSEGGLAVAAAEMCIGGRLGLELRLRRR